jgi:hypothetical protein
MNSRAGVSIMIHSLFSTSRLAFLLTALLVVASFAAPMASAQDAPAEITFRINKYTCDRDPGDVSPIADNIPDYCSPTAGVAFEVALEDGTVVGSCTTDASGLCSLQAPNEATVIVTEDTASSPAGTVPRENPITTQVVTEFAGAVFINLPETTELPDTGSGPSENASGTGLFAAALGGSLLCGATAIMVRRRRA